MKKILFLLLLCMFFVSTQVIGQDPYTRLKQTAEQQPVLRQQMAKVAITESDRRLKVTRKNPIPFKSFEMVDMNGRKIDPNETIVVNGRNENAKVFFDKLNEIEKEQNAKGYSIKNTKDAMVIHVVTPDSELDGRVREMSKSIGRLKSENELKDLTATTKNVGNLVLKPYELYSAAEKMKIAQTKFSVDASGNLKATTNPGNVNTTIKNGSNFKKHGITNAPIGKLKDLAVDGSSHPSGTATPVKVIGEISTNDWSFGIMSTFKAGVKADLLRSAKIYSFNPESPGKSMSEFKVSAHAQVYGGLFGHSLDMLSGGIEFFAPADSSKKMTAKGQILLAGTTILSINESITQSKAYNKSMGKSIDESFPISIPICCGIGFDGKIGVKGNVGLNYSGAIYRTIVSLEAEPVIDIKGYAEAGLSIGGVAKLGAGSELTFIKGHLPLNAFVGIWAQNADQIVVGYNYYMGFDLNVLSGRVYGYADACVPHVACYRLGEVDFFTWGGFKGSGTFAEGGNTYTIANL